VVGVHDFGELPAGGAFLVMDLLRGVSWREMLVRRGRLELDTVADWVSDLCAGVAAAHAQNVIHRDLKPENVFICGDGQRETAIVLDFGVAKLQTDTDPKRPRVSVTGAIIGTECYMSPEQRAGWTVGPASDVFSIAVMVLETLSQSRPPAIAGKKWVESALEKLGGSTAIQNILRWALAEDPNERISDARALGDRLSAAIRLERPTITTGAGSSDDETFTLGAAN
jgi:serine/threonine protein kinase